MPHDYDYCVKLHKQTYGDKSVAPYIYSYAPGRMNFIGEHVDYMGGCVVPAAVQSACHLVIDASDSDEWVFDFSSSFVDDGGVISIHLSDKDSIQANKSFRTICFGAVYQAWKLCKVESKHLKPLHMRCVIDGKVPVGAGISSSASICVAIIFALVQYFIPENAKVLRGECSNSTEEKEFETFKTEIAKAARAVEVEHCGVNIGIMDQYTSIHGKLNTVLKIDCAAMTHELVHMPDPTKTHYSTILVNSMRAHNLGADYNKIRSDMENAQTKIDEYFQKLNTNVHEKITLKKMVGKRYEGGKTAVQFIEDLKKQGILTQGECDRSSYSVSEMERTEEFVGLTKDPKMIAAPIEMLKRMGQLLNETHDGMSKQLCVSTEEVETIHKLLLKSPGVYGSRIMGGGFGGCVIAIVDKDKFTDSVRAEVRTNFKNTFPDVGECDIYDAPIGKGAYVLTNVQ